MYTVRLAEPNTASPEQDLLIVYAEAFDRDADPDDFSLECILAHERGHQLLARHPRLTRNLPATWSGVTEEIVASLLATLLLDGEEDQRNRLLKAVFLQPRIRVWNPNARRL